MKKDQSFNTDRREFLRNSGYLMIGFSLVLETNYVSAESAFLPDKNSVESWIRIDSGGILTVLTGKMELGQGIRTALMQIAADELDIDMKNVRIIIADTDQTQNENYTAGSGSIEGSGKAIRNAAAEARNYLLQLAGKQLKTPIDKLTVENGIVKSEASGKTISYKELLNGKHIEAQVTGKASLKNHTDYKLVGKSVPRNDIKAMVTAAPYYIQDLRLPNMVHARILRPPVYESKLVSLPKNEIEALPGILKVVVNGSFVGVIASKEYQSIRALNLLKEKSEWEKKPISPLQKDLFDDIIKSSSNGEVVEDDSSLYEKMAKADDHHEATYKRPYHMHGSIGPSCAIALWENDRLKVWSHSQGVYPLRKTLSNLLGISEDKISVTGVPGAGCYGHNGADDVAADAALLAREITGKPVRVQWMREDEHKWEPYGSAMIMKIKGGLNENGKIIAWDTNLWSDTHSTRPGGKAGHFVAARDLQKPFALQAGGFSGGSHRNSIPLYKFDSKKVTLHNYDGPLRTSALRSLGAYANIFALESFMDEMAFKAGKDPVQFHLDHLEDDRAKEVIKTLADTGSKEKRIPGRGEGFAFAQYKNTASYFAVKAEIQLDKVKKQFRITKLTGVIDSGQAINPDGIKNQTSGGMIQAASWTLMEQVTYSSEEILSTSWETYPIIRFQDIPDTEVIVINRPELPPLGAGEAAQGPTAAAIANAIFNATGSRLRDLPLTADKIDWDKVPV